MDSTFLSTGTEDSTAISRDDEIVEIMIRQALVAVKRCNYTDAITQLNKVLEHGTGNFRILGEIYMWYGRVCRELKDYKQALEFLERELAIKQLQTDSVGACDVFRRTIGLETEMGNYAKAKRTAESFVEFATAKCEQDVEQARVLLITVCLEGFECETNREDRMKLLAEASDEITSAKKINGDAVNILMLDAKCKAFQGRANANPELKEESRAIYEKCIEMGLAAKDFQTVSRAYYERAVCAGNNRSGPLKEDLRRAVIYAEAAGKPSDAAMHKIVLSKILIHCNSADEALLHLKSALATAQKEESRLITSGLLTMAACLNALGRTPQAAYFVVLGSVLTVDDNILPFYEMIDQMMVTERAKTPEGTETLLAVDASEDDSPNEAAAKFVVKLEHTTNVDTWKSVVKDLITAAKKKKPVKKEEEPVDLLELICQMNDRLDGQRCVLPTFTYQRPPSAASSTGTTKSHKFPGLRTTMMKFKDKHIMSRLHRSKKSSASMPTTPRNNTTISSSTSK